MSLVQFSRSASEMTARFKARAYKFVIGVIFLVHFSPSPLKETKKKSVC